MPVRFHDDLGAAADGPLDGRTSRSGHRWRATAAGTDQRPVVLDRAIGPPAGHVPGSSGAADAGYATVDLGVVATRVGAEFRWDRSASVSSAATLGAFTWPATGVPDSTPLRDGGSNMHLGLTPESVGFAVFTHGTAEGFDFLVPEGHDVGQVPLRRRMRCDGRTRHRVDVLVRGDVANVAVDDEPLLVYRDPRIATVPASFPFWEYYSVPGGDNLPRFVRVWAA